MKQTAYAVTDKTIKRYNFMCVSKTLCIKAIFYLKASLTSSTINRPQINKYKHTSTYSNSPMSCSVNSIIPLTHDMYLNDVQHERV